MVCETRPPFAKPNSVDLSPDYQFLIAEALLQADGNQSIAARILSINSQALHKLLKQQVID